MVDHIKYTNHDRFSPQLELFLSKLSLRRIFRLTFLQIKNKSIGKKTHEISIIQAAQKFFYTVSS